MTNRSKAAYPIRPFIVLIIVTMSLCFLPLSAAYAQDEPIPTSDSAGPAEEATPVLYIPPEEIPNDASLPLVYGIVGVMALLLIGAMIYGSYITRFLATLLPPETASAIYASGVRFGLQVALNQAGQTPGPLDDEFFIEMARLRGLQVIKRLDGTYEVTQNSNHTTPFIPV